MLGFLFLCSFRGGDHFIRASDAAELGSPFMDNDTAWTPSYAPFIVGGVEVTPDDEFSNTIVGVVNFEKGSLCTGSLISRSLVLTAAHCVGNSAQSLRVFTGLRRSEPTSILDVTEFKIPSVWPDHKTADHDRGDLAILRITGDLPRKYHPVSILAQDELQAQQEILVAGYGRNDGVNKKGAGILRKVSLAVVDPHYGNTEVLIDQQFGKGACHGDSGGPAYIKTSAGYQLWGVTSREHDDPEKDCTHFSIYTKVIPYLSWIRDNL